MNFSVILNIRDMLICNCLKNTNNIEVTVTSTSQIINLQNGFTLNVVAVSENYVTVLIQNGSYVIIRKIYSNYDMNICIPTSNPCKCKHILTLGLSSITING